MHPVLIKWGPITVNSYGFFIALAFIAALLWTTREVRQKNLDQGLLSNLAFFLVLGAIVGSRILYILLNLDYFSSHPVEMLMFWKGGLVFLGGVILAAALAYWYLIIRHKQSPWPWMDALAPGLALGQGVGRIGCLMAGCCYGDVCELPWALKFPAQSLVPPYLQNTPLHPTQLYHSLAGFTSFAILLIIKRRIKRPGRLMGSLAVLYALFRFNIEFFRADYRGTIGFLSVTQVLTIGVFALGLVIIALAPKKTP